MDAVGFVLALVAGGLVIVSATHAMLWLLCLKPRGNPWNWRAAVGPGFYQDWLDQQR